MPDKQVRKRMERRVQSLISVRLDTSGILIYILTSRKEKSSEIICKASLGIVCLR